MSDIASVQIAAQGHTVTYSDGTISSVPDDLSNRDHRAVLSWIADGNTPDPKPVIPFQPTDHDVLIEALTSGPNPPLNQGLLTAARQRLRSQGP